VNGAESRQVQGIVVRSATKKERVLGSRDLSELRPKCAAHPSVEKPVLSSHSFYVSLFPEDLCFSLLL
jgi:hypothetical protein